MANYDLTRVNLDVEKYLVQNSHYSVLASVLASEAKKVKSVYAFLPQDFSFYVDNLKQSAGLNPTLAIEALRRFLDHKNVDQILLDDFEARATDPGIDDLGYTYVETNKQVTWLLNLPATLQNLDKFLSLANGIVHAAFIGTSKLNIQSGKIQEENFLHICRNCEFFSYSIFHDESFLIFEK